MGAKAGSRKAKVSSATTQIDLIDSPLRSTPHKTTIVRNLGTLTRVTAGDVPTERRGAAALDGGHDLHLSDTDMAPIRFTPNGAVVAEDIRDLQRWPGHRPGRLVGLFL